MAQRAPDVVEQSFRSSGVEAHAGVTLHVWSEHEDARILRRGLVDLDDPSSRSSIKHLCSSESYARITTDESDSHHHIATVVQPSPFACDASHGS